jgi:hypothetical protein
MGTKITARMGAVAKGLVLALATSAPEIALSGLNLDFISPFLGNNGITHSLLLVALFDPVCVLPWPCAPQRKR